MFAIIIDYLMLSLLFYLFYAFFKVIILYSFLRYFSCSIVTWIRSRSKSVVVTYNELGLFGNNSRRKCALTTLPALVKMVWVIFSVRVCQRRPSWRQCVLTKKIYLCPTRRKRVNVHCTGSQPGCCKTIWNILFKKKRFHEKYSAVRNNTDFIIKLIVFHIFWRTTVMFNLFCFHTGSIAIASMWTVFILPFIHGEVLVTLSIFIFIKHVPTK